MKVGYVEPLDPISTLSPGTSVLTNTQVGPFGFLTVGTAGSLVYVPPNGSEKTLRWVKSGEFSLAFKEIKSSGTTATGFSGRNVSLLNRAFSVFDPFTLTDWPSDRQDKLPLLARTGRIFRDNFGAFHSNITAQDLLPDDWETWPVVYVDPVTGKDNSPSTHDGTTPARA